MTTPDARRALAVALAAGILSACGGSSGAAPGTEGGPCYPNDTCNRGLQCLSTLCVRVDVDAGATDDAADTKFAAAPHPPLPQVANLGGPVLAVPVVQPILFASDPDGDAVRAFLQELTVTPYWNETTSEYGVGAIAVLPANTFTAPAPAMVSDDDLVATLVANTSGPNPIWGPPDPNTIYLYILPEGTVATVSDTTCCTDVGGYHDETRSGAVTVPYAVACACPGFLGPGVTALQERTAAISHELIEAATDPFPESNPAYIQEDRADLVWTFVTGGELGDMCALDADAPYVPPGSTSMIQRSWSNAAAKRGEDPCVPHRTAGPYFNSYPALEAVPYGPASNGYTTLGINVPIGQSRTIDVTLSSTAATTGPWTVSAYDYDYLVGGDGSHLGLALDKAEGQNGDTLRLTISPKVANPQIGGEIFVIYSVHGTAGDPDFQTNMTMGLVAN